MLVLPSVRSSNIPSGVVLITTVRRETSVDIEEWDAETATGIPRANAYEGLGGGLDSSRPLGMTD
jgi:hypothetical protein